LRVHIYAQELTREVTLVHHGVRFWLQSPSCLHCSPDDDDRSAVTFWLPRDGSFSPGDLAAMFRLAAQYAALAGDGSPQPK
jgi:hypothetical protein